MHIKKAHTNQDKYIQGISFSVNKNLENALIILKDAIKTCHVLGFALLLGIT